ncbi:DUF1427 family protein [Dyella humicola]|uniref:DUF1427 family protein n=1 Tax=Dyella humicola TaxID=2992126 RepID=UPI0022597560|nr:DUF1427 family protein [Dyella humicola]
MKIYLLSLAAGLLVGVVYGLIQVRSPAPPVVALIGLLGILLGEQAVPIAKKVILGGGVTAAYCAEQLREQTFAQLPQHHPKPDTKHSEDPS